VVMGLSSSYGLTFAVMALWGVGGGITMTLQRGLLQRHTPDELMGRVMGLASLAMIGSFPLAAAVAAGLTSALDAADALFVTGVGAVVVAVLLGSRRALRDA
jgi:sugar phosphate permease